MCPPRCTPLKDHPDQAASKSLTSSRKQRPGKNVIEKNPDGDDDFRAYEQAQQLPRLVPASGRVPEEVLEIPVQIPVPEQASTLQIRRSVFEDAKRRHKCMDDLPILPANLESGCNDGYLHNRGRKFYTLTQGPQAVEYLDEAGKVRHGQPSTRRPLLGFL